MDFSDCTLMIVDDTDVNIDILVETLGDEYDLSVAMDGETALEDMIENPPDLLLLDIMMPGIDGFEVLRRMRANPALQEIPVIFITGVSDASEEAKGIDLGALDFITKPISAPIVKARVKNYLELIMARKTVAGG